MVGSLPEGASLDSISDARILIVEDDEDSINMLTIWLETMGYDNIRAVDDAAAVMEAHEEFRPDIVLIDRYIRGFDGLELVRQMTRRSSAPIIVTSGDVSPTAERDALAAGATAFVLKPYSPKNLIGKIASLLSVALEEGSSDTP